MISAAPCGRLEEVRADSISVIIPVYDEASQIGGLLTQLTTARSFDEIIVVDGGSSDRTVEIARSFRDVRVLQASRGRAAQMNAGAAEARGEILLFLHADVRLPRSAASVIPRVLANPGVVAGAFRTWTVCDDPTAPNRWLAPLLRLADLRSRITRLPYGDQGIFVRASAFRTVGGFPQIPLMEDLAFSQRIRNIGSIARAPATVRVSGRRYLERPIYFTALVNLFPLLYRLGVSPARLARLYRPVRAEPPDSG